MSSEKPEEKASRVLRERAATEKRIERPPADKMLRERQVKKK